MTKKFKSILILALVAILVWNYRDKINEFATEMWYRLPFSIGRETKELPEYSDKSSYKYYYVEPIEMTTEADREAWTINQK